MCIIIFIIAAILGATIWLWSASGWAIPFMVVVTLLIAAIVTKIGEEHPTAQDVICLIASLIISIISVSINGAYVLYFFVLGGIGLSKGCSLLLDNCVEVPIVPGLNLANVPDYIRNKLVDEELTNFVEMLVILPFVAFYLLIGVPYYTNPDVLVLAFIPSMYLFLRVFKSFFAERY